MQEYLSGVSHAVTVERAFGDPAYRTTTGTSEPNPPADLDLWAVKAAGPAEQAVTCAPVDGSWTVVLMDRPARRRSP